MRFISLRFVVVLLLLSCFRAAALVSTSTSRVSFRTGLKSDELAIKTTLGKELMNPLGVSAENFVVAVADNDVRVGWAQIRPLGTAQRDPERFDARPGSYDLQRDVDDAMWDEFEAEEDTVVPNGFASLPWTKEYRAFAEAAKKRRERRAKLVEEREKSLTMLYELASVYVYPDYRGQGIGKELIRRAIQRHVDAGHSVSDLYLLTLATTVRWYYDSFGFEAISDDKVPAQMSFEMSAGKLITSFTGNAKLCCMCGSDKDISQ